MCTVHRNRTLSRRYIRNVYCTKKHNTLHTVHIKQYLQIIKRHLQTKLSPLQPFKYPNICCQHTTKATHKLHTVGTALCIPFNICSVHMLVLRMVVDGMQVMNNIKCGIYSFYVRHNLTVGFLRHCSQYGHYFIRQLSVAT
jgi:hypothetical protein